MGSIELGYNRWFHFRHLVYPNYPFIFIISFILMILTLHRLVSEFLRVARRAYSENPASELSEVSCLSNCESVIHLK